MGASAKCVYCLSSGLILALAENPLTPDVPITQPPTPHRARHPMRPDMRPIYNGEMKPANWRSAALLKGRAAKATFTCALSFWLGSVCRDLSLFMGMDKHIKHKKKKNLKRKLLPSDSAIDKGKVH